MVRARGSRQFKWAHWCFTYPHDILYRQSQYKVETQHLTKEDSGCIRCARIMKVTILVVGKGHSIGCHILLPPQVQIVQVFVKKLVWTGRGLREITSHMTAYNLKAKGCWTYKGLKQKQ